LTMKALLLDFDGTIMDTNDIIIASWQHTFRTLRGREGDRRTILGTFGEPLELSMRNLFPEVPSEKSLWTYRNYQRENFLSCIHLFPGVREMLDELQSRGCPMALVTSRLKYTTDQALDAFDLRRYFPVIVTADEVPRYKPDPQCAQIAMDRLGVVPEETVMVGDTVHDILCAKNAGVTAVLVAWSMTLSGKGRSDFAPSEAPNALIDTPEQLLEMI